MGRRDTITLRKNMRITLKLLQRKDACPSARQEFARVFGQRATLSKENLLLWLGKPKEWNIEQRWERSHRCRMMWLVYMINDLLGGSVRAPLLNDRTYDHQQRAIMRWFDSLPETRHGSSQKKRKATA